MVAWTSWNPLTLTYAIDNRLTAPWTTPQRIHHHTRHFHCDVASWRFCWGYLWVWASCWAHHCNPSVTEVGDPRRYRGEQPPGAPQLATGYRMSSQSVNRKVHKTVLSGGRSCQLTLGDMLTVEFPERVSLHSNTNHRILVTVTGWNVFITRLRCSDGLRCIREDKHVLKLLNFIRKWVSTNHKTEGAVCWRIFVFPGRLTRKKILKSRI